MLARGHGLLGGGVEVDCFAADRRAFRLTVSSQTERGRGRRGIGGKKERLGEEGGG